MPELVAHLDDQSFAQAESGLWLVDFYGSWCGPCRALEPVLDELAQETHPARIAKVEIGESPDLKRRFGIATVPTLVVLRDGAVMKTIIGARPKSVLARALAAAGDA